MGRSGAKPSLLCSSNLCSHQKLSSTILGWFLSLVGMVDDSRHQHYLAVRQDRIISTSECAKWPPAPSARLCAQGGRIFACFDSYPYSVLFIIVVCEVVLSNLFPKTWAKRTMAKGYMVVRFYYRACLLFLSYRDYRMALLDSSIRSHSTWVIWFSTYTRIVLTGLMIENCTKPSALAFEQATIRAICAIDIITDALSENHHLCYKSKPM